MHIYLYFFWLGLSNCIYELFCYKILHFFFWIFKYQKERTFRSVHILDVLVLQSCFSVFHVYNDWGVITFGSHLLRWHRQLTNCVKLTKAQWVNPFHANVLFLYPLKTSDVLRGYRNRTLTWKGLKDTKADLRICQNLPLHIQIICWRFHVKAPFISWDIRPWDMWKVCLQTLRNNRIS